MRKSIPVFITLLFILWGCGASKINLKDAYVYNPASHNASKYPVNAVVIGGYESGRVDLSEDILDIYIKELEGANLFTNVDKKSPTRADISIDIKFSDFKEDGKPGLTLNVIIKQVPENKLIYKNKFSSTGDKNSFDTAEGYAELLKKVITDSIADIDRKFAQFQKDGNLPNHPGK